VNARLARAVASGGVVWFVVAVLLVIAAVEGEDFGTSNNLTNVGRQAVVLALVALAQFVVVLAAGVDLSIAANVKITSILAAMSMQGSDERFFAGVLAALAVGAGIGLVNGLVVTKLRVEPFIATLGTGALVQGLALSIASTPKGRSSPLLGDLYAQRFLFDVYLVTFLVAAVWVVAWFVLNRLRPGRHLYATGAAADVAGLSGVRVDRVRIGAFVVAGLLGGLAGLVTLAGSGIGDPNAAVGLEFTSLAIVVIGGASLAGGRGRLLGVLGGVVLFALLGNVFTMLKVEVWYQQGIRGLVILIAASLYVQRRRRAAPARLATA
jgi:ribose transport system permease protein